MGAQWISGLGVGGEKCGTLMRLLQRGSGLSSGFLQVESLLGGPLAGLRAEVIKGQLAQC